MKNDIFLWVQLLDLFNAFKVQKEKKDMYRKHEQGTLCNLLSENGLKHWSRFTQQRSFEYM